MQPTKEKINSKISKQKHIIEEIGENGEVQYNCTACRKTFRSRSQRYYHINCNELLNLTFKCDHCDKSFAREAQLKYHIKSHISPINDCAKCQKTFANPLALKKHEALHEIKPKSCPHCDKTFKKPISLQQHIAGQHLNQLQYGCAYCSKKYASKSTLQLHLQTHEEKRFECTFCGKLFQRNSILNLHLKRHYKSNSYICVVCQKVFSDSGSLARHHKIHEGSASQYYCKLCDKSILRKDNMTRHLITIHPNEKFDNVVQIIGQSTAIRGGEGEESDLYKSEQEDISKSDRKCLIKDNKELVHKPKEPKTETVEYPLANQIRVITAISNYKNETKNIENTSLEITNKFKNINHQRQENSTLFQNNKASISENYNCIKEEDKAINRNDNAENTSFFNHVQLHLNKSNSTDHKIEEYELDKCAKVFHNAHENDTANVYQQKILENHEISLPQNCSSVIRSVGNVKNKLKLPKSKTHASVEYKHKKYCRTHYNIDLYRKILGCDEDDDEGNVKQQQKFDNILKSSTPVHWRKCFKNNYETSTS